MRILWTSFVTIFLGLSSLSFGQQELNLAKALQEQQIKAENRTLSLYEKQPGAVEMNAAEGDGLAVIKEIAFETGTIEVELLGENNPGRSFIGLAFNVQDSETYEAVYFRPFNFVATQAIRKAHMVQYIHHPEFSWFKLREERTGEFENEIAHPPDPDGWFKTTLIISEKNVSVYLEDNTEPVLKVERLTSGKSDRIGLWVGNGSSGRFMNLKVHTD